MNTVLYGSTGQPRLCSVCGAPATVNFLITYAPANPMPHLLQPTCDKHNPHHIEFASSRKDKRITQLEQALHAAGIPIPTEEP